MKVNWSEKCEGPGEGINEVHYAPEFTLVKNIINQVLSINGSEMTSA